MKIRDGEIGDAEQIKQLADMSLKRHFWMSWTPDSIFQNCHKVVVAVQDNKVVGFALGSRKQNKGYLLAVHPDYRGIGIGTKLAQEFVKWHVIRKSLGFFQAVGFKETEILRKSTKGYENDTFLVEKQVTDTSLPPNPKGSGIREEIL